MKQKITVTVNGSTEIVCNKNENLLRVLDQTQKIANNLQNRN